MPYDVAAKATFLSTPSARRATAEQKATRAEPRNFYPRPPQGGRLGRLRFAQELYISIHALRKEGDEVGGGVGAGHKLISIHALRKEGDECKGIKSATAYNFYPRPPQGGRPDNDAAVFRQHGEISIHALRKEGDEVHRLCADFPLEFLSTPSARRATVDRFARLERIVFLSTPSARRATQQRGRPHPEQGISIHALRKEGD